MSPPHVQISEDEFEHTLEGARNGDHQSFAILWRAFNPGLIRYLGGLANPEDAQDLASAVWVDVVRGLDRFEGNQPGFRAWLCTIGRHRTVDLRRAEGRRPQSARQEPDGQRLDPLGDPGSDMEGRWSTEAAVALIGALPEDQAEVLLLRIVADLDVATVAQILGKRPGTVRVLAHRGLKRLAQQLEQRPVRAEE